MPNLPRLKHTPSPEAQEAFRAWLSSRQEMAGYNIVDAVDDFPTPTYGRAGLERAEAILIERFSDGGAIKADRDAWDEFAFMFGQCFVEGLGFEWVHVVNAKDESTNFLVERDDITASFPVYDMVTAAIARNTGRYWTFVYDNMAEDIENLHTDTGEPPAE